MTAAGPTDDTSMELYDGFREQFDALLDEHRHALRNSLNGLTEDEARRKLVPSRTTLLGLVKHVTFVEGVYFDEAITGRSRRAIGIASTPDRSFVLNKNDTIESIQAAHARACEASRRAASTLRLHDVVTGRGEQRVGRIYQIMLRELAQHCGHAEILREQILDARDHSP
jgi:hypothetical protein